MLRLDEEAMTMEKENIGSSLDDFLREEGIYEEVTATAIERRMQTSRATPDRLLDPKNDALS